MRVYKRILATLLVTLMIITSASLNGLTDLFISKASAVNYSIGDYIQYGNYPQSLETESSKISKLDSIEKNWISYDYYFSSDSDEAQIIMGDYMKYADIDIDADGLKDYRAVLINRYRRSYTHGGESLYTESEQHKNGYDVNNVYYFKYEPVLWKIIDPSNGFIVSNIILDSQAYNNYIVRNDRYEYFGDPDKTYYANDYFNSSIRKWLNKDFYNTAFTKEQAQNIRQDVMLNNNTSDIYSNYNSQATRDKIFLLSRNEITYGSYELSTNEENYDANKHVYFSDYAECQGLSTRIYSVAEYPAAWWWERTPSRVYSSNACYTFDAVLGLSDCNVDYFSCGIRPACRLVSIKSDISKSSIDNNIGTGIRDLCDHINIIKYDAQPATCTTKGYTAGVYCNDCRQWTEKRKEVILPHVDSNGDKICDVCANPISDIYPGETKTVEIESEKITYLRFIPSVSGVYSFQSTADSDTYGFLYDANKDEITHDDDEGSNSNFKITYTLEKGTTYYFGCRYYDELSSGSFSVCLELEEMVCDHENVEKVTEVQPVNCLILGYTEGVRCVDCNVWISGHEIIVHPHAEVIVPAVAPTCTVKGLTEGKRCSVCGFDIVEQTELPIKHTDEDKNGYCDICKTPLSEINVNEIDRSSMKDYGNYYSKRLQFVPETTHTYILYGYIDDSQTNVRIYDENGNKISYGDGYIRNDEDNATIYTYAKLTKGRLYYLEAYSKWTNYCQLKIVLNDNYDCYHERVEIVNQKNASCMAEGYSGDVICADCGEFIEEGNMLPKLDHVLSIDRGTAPTCTAVGYTEGAHCSECGDIIIPLTVIPALGHDMGEYVTTSPATCKSEGVSTSSCSRCEYKETKSVNKLPHTEKTINVKNSTCKTEGYTGDVVCSACSTVIKKGKVIAKLTHTEVIDAAVEPTCTKTGLSEGKKCSVCGEILVVPTTVDALGHTSDAGTVTKKASCTAAGTKTYKCTVCGEVLKTETLNKTAHKLVAIPAVEATCTSVGKTEGKKCSVCGTITVAQTDVAKKSHAYKNIVTKATLTKNGKITPACSVCKATKTATTVYYPKTFTLSATSYTYDGKAKKPTVTVTDSNGKVIANTNYTLSYSANTEIGTAATVKITFKGNYSGSKSIKFKIVPTQVTGLKASTVATTSIKLSWTKVNGVKYYKVEQSADGKTWKVLTTTDKTTYTVSKLTAGSKMQFRVTALDSTKKIAGKVSATLKTGTLTSAPTVTLTSTKSKTATVSWKKVTGASKYMVYKSTDNKKWIKVGETTKLTYDLTKLTGGKKIYVKIVAVNAYKVNSADSKVVSVTVKK